MTAFYPSCKIISSILDKYDILIFKKPNVDFTQCVNQASFGASCCVQNRQVFCLYRLNQQRFPTLELY